MASSSHAAHQRGASRGRRRRDRTDLSDPRIGFVTVTSVETSPDLRAAKVYVSVLGSEEEREATLDRPALLARRAPVADRRRDADEAHARP